jgi:hypothetical protein
MIRKRATYVTRLLNRRFLARFGNSENAFAVAIERIADGDHLKDGYCRTGKNRTLSFFI